MSGEVLLDDPAGMVAEAPRVAAALPLLYLHGLSTSDFAPALTQFLGSDAGLSAATTNRLTTQWQDEAAAFHKRSLAETDYVCVWVDGIHLKVRLEYVFYALRDHHVRALGPPSGLGMTRRPAPISWSVPVVQVMTPTRRGRPF